MRMEVSQSSIVFFLILFVISWIIQKSFIIGMNHDISQPVPQGGDRAQDAENSRIAAIADELERLCAVHEAQCGDSLQDVSRLKMKARHISVYADC